MMDSLGAEWAINQLNNQPDNAVTLIGADSNSFTYMLYPRRLSDGRILSLQYGYDKMYSFIITDTATGKEQCLYRSYEINTDQPFSVYKNLLMFTETENHPRWGMSSNTAIRILNINTGKIQSHRAESRRLSPSFSPDGRTIAAVEHTTTNNCALVLLDLVSGELLRRYNVYNGDYLQTPSWSPDGRTIVFTHIRKTGGKALSALDTETGLARIILDYGHHDIAFPVLTNESVFFQASFDGSENIYAIHLSDSALWRVTSEPFAGRYPSVDSWSGQLIFSALTAGGYAVKSIRTDLPFIKMGFPQEHRDDKRLTEILNQEKGQFSKADTTADAGYEFRKYTGLFNGNSFYQWGLQNLDSAYNLSMAVQAKNLTNTLGAGMSFIHNLYDQTSTFNTEVSYSKYYPVFDAGFNVGDRTNYTFTPDRDGDDSVATYSWYQEAAYFGVRIPIDLSKRNYFAGLTLATFVKYQNNHSAVPHLEFDGSFTPVTHSLRFSRYTLWLKDMKPRWGQFVKGSYSYTPMITSALYHSDFIAATGMFYFPGLVRYHSLFFEQGAEIHSDGFHLYKPEVRFSRGYQPFTANEQVLFSVNYLFPLLCPDLNILTVMYMKRIATKLFYDYTHLHYTRIQGMNFDRRLYFRSVGVELTSETFLFRLPVPVDMGIRWSYLLDQNKKSFYEMILTFDRF